jgi:hypothetical protein
VNLLVDKPRPWPHDGAPGRWLAESLEMVYKYFRKQKCDLLASQVGVDTSGSIYRHFAKTWLLWLDSYGVFTWISGGGLGGHFPKGRIRHWP